jgi:hypothetical protein
LGFKFKPGDSVKLLGKEGKLIVVICQLSFVGVDQRVERSYLLSSRHLDEKMLIAPESIVVEDLLSPTHHDSSPLLDDRFRDGK